MSELVKTKTLCEALGKPRKVVLERAYSENWFYVERSGGLQFLESKLPVDVRLALSCNKKTPVLRFDDKKELPVAGHIYCSATDKEREMATWRSAFISAYKKSMLSKEDFIDAYNAKLVSEVLFQKLGKVSMRTLYRWLKDFNDYGASGITPKYSTRKTGIGESLSQAEKELLMHFYLKDTQPTIAHVLFLMKKNIPYSTCSYPTARRYLNSLPKSLIDFHRLGITKFTNLHQPYIDQNIAKYKSLDKVVSDHHCLDCVVLYRGKLIRPWITTFQDYRSGKILGWCMSVKPSSLSIIVAYYMCCIQYGIPQELIFDNGKDYRSALLNGKNETVKVLTPELLEEEQMVHIDGLFSLVGSEVKFTQVYNGKSKGRQERFFQLIKEYFSKEIGGYIGGDVTERPEDSIRYFRAINGKAKRDDLPTWEYCCESINKMIPYINDTFISDGKGMDGKTRSQVFGENLPDNIRHVNKETLRSALSKGSVAKVRNSIIRSNKIDYYHPDLITYSGTEVIIRQSLLTDEEITVCNIEGQFICTALANYFFEGESLNNATQRVKEARNYSLQKLAEIGTKEVQVDPEHKTMIDVVSNTYKQNEIIGIDDYLALPKAVGAEDVTYEDYKDEESEKPKLLKGFFDE